ncbi:MAG: multifunctional CCA addition/repair protein [Gammaproteobacteria bacterium]|nr:multifunctional CCA addition/repair protein [Gammaproteobacteria bacterium]MXW45311.1 multifunctional CCA addition/repair protein [Gammaproteobacteria bacterium]MYD01970.1 multifunctional CCA addition/repair protein [Gammaproteobacteria bacterium]MYI25506.1 multifunctional CCA addition/repair protein [Gammaproteobacteria bacterium]
MKSYLVGGAVRDRLLGLEVRERDWVVVGTTADELLKQGYKEIGRSFPVFLHPDTQEEYALARRETKTAPGYRGFEVDFGPEVTLEEDLLRRDLTINAMAEDDAGRLVDPHGGERDLAEKVLRHVSPAFREDPVRILRVARFAARFDGLGFAIAPETMALMGEMVARGEAAALVPERVWQETVRALGEDAPQRFFEVLRECGALKVIFPEIDRLWGVPQPKRWHPEIDTGVHVMMVLEQAARFSPSVEVRFAALTHDLGKGVTPEQYWPRHSGHEAASVRLVGEMCERLGAPKRFRTLAEKVARYHGVCHRADELRPDTKLKVLESLGAFRADSLLEDFLVACEADYRGRLGMTEDAYPAADVFRRAFAAACTVSGADLADEGYEGARLGDELRRRRIAAIAET